MKKKNILLSLIYLFAVVLAGVFTACEDEQDLGNAPRLFAPVFDEVSYGGTWIKATWDQYEGVDSFFVEVFLNDFEQYDGSISTDTTFVQQLYVDTTFYTFDNLKYDTDYQLRIKAVGAGIGDSRYYFSNYVTTSDFPTKLNSIEKGDALDVKVLVSWTELAYDSLVFAFEANPDSTTKKYDLTAAENELKKLVINGLTPDTAYRVSVFKDGAYLGKKRFSTKPKEVLVEPFVDWRDQTQEESTLAITQAFLDGLEEGTTVYLAGGNTYELNGGAISKSVTLVTGLSLFGKAQVQVAGNFDLAAGSTVNKFMMKNISFIDHPNKPKDTDSNYGGTYVMNISNAGVIDSLRFEDCEIRYKRGVLRIKTGATVKNIQMESCWADSISGYGVVNLDNGDIINEKIELRNCTFTHVDGYIIRGSKPALPPSSVIVENITTCYAPQSTRYFFDFGSSAIAELSVTNSVFGPGFADAAVRGWNFGLEGSIATLNSNYVTKDLVWDSVVNAETGEVTLNDPFDPIDVLSGDANTIFSDITVNDYTVTDSKLVNKIGDSRWW